MDIIKEEISKVNALIKVKLTPEDYKENYTKSLKDYRKQVNLPGFRPGNAPEGLIKKKYGPSILADEVNKLLSESMDKYIKENEIELLGRPMPKEDEAQNIDWNNPGEMEFTYEIGISPEINLELNDKLKLDFHKIKVDDKTIDKEISDLRKRYGKMQNVDSAEETDMLFGKFEELDADGNIKDDGVSNDSTVSIEFLEDKKMQKKLIGKKPGDEIKLNPADVSRGEADLAAMLDVKKEELAELSDQFLFTINEVKRIDEAELNQELFDKLFGEGQVKSEAELREKIKEGIEQSFKHQSERFFRNNASETIVDKLKLELPEDFLKRWIHESNEKPVSMEEIEKEFSDYSKGLQWQIIVNRLTKKYEIKVEFDEVQARVKQLLVQQYAQYGMPAPEGTELDEAVAKVLQNQDEAMRIYEMLLEDKLFDLIKEKAKINEKEVSLEEFTKLAEKK